MTSREVSRVTDSSAWEASLAEHRQVLDTSTCLGPTITLAAQAIRDTLTARGKILICGNGGSHAHAQHFAAELVVRFKRNRNPMASIALGSNPAVLTAVNNDLDPRDIFVREAVALLAPRDVLIGISTSGVSPNVCRALAVATELKAITIGLTGRGGMGVPVTHEICVPSTSTARIQELHTMIIHSVCEALDA